MKLKPKDPRPSPLFLHVTYVGGRKTVQPTTKPLVTLLFGRYRKMRGVK